MLTIYVDADSCPVRQEVFRVAKRCGLDVFIVANVFQSVPSDGSVKLIVVASGDDVADDWIVDHAGAGDIVITADILLASRCLKLRARAIDPKGQEFTDDSIGSQLAARELARHLRETGVEIARAAPMAQKDRSRFLNVLDTVIQSIRRDARL